MQMHIQLSFFKLYNTAICGEYIYTKSLAPQDVGVHKSVNISPTELSLLDYIRPLVASCWDPLSWLRLVKKNDLGCVFTNSPTPHYTRTSPHDVTSCQWSAGVEPEWPFPTERGHEARDTHTHTHTFEAHQNHREV